MIKALCEAATGSWSANQIFAHVQLLGYRGRRTETLFAIGEACGKSGKRGGKLAAPTGSATGSATGSEPLAKEKEKNQKKKKTTLYTPGETSSLLTPRAFGAIEAEVEQFLVFLSEQREEFSLASARKAVREIARARDAYGNDAVVYALDETVDKPAGLAYFNAVVMNRATGSRRTRNGSHATGSDATQLGLIGSPIDEPDDAAVWGDDIAELVIQSKA